MALKELNRQELLRDLALCGCGLADERSTRFAAEGAHDPTATRYFVLEQLFAQLDLDESSHLLDVGCGKGRALAYFAEAKLPGCATGVELDPDLARTAQAWTENFEQLSVIEGSALSVPLRRFTHFYLFNPFDSPILEQFVEKIEAETRRPITLCHMSDNGENYLFMGRSGWRLQSEGWIHIHQGAPVFGCPQHWSIWKFDPAAR
ncbi:MAG: methyltransferase domain-containing protein [Eggerthellaceae bacterium]|nr:methyltransferase domain-containing protein [Eggerthellaceae bacterium]